MKGVPRATAAELRALSAALNRKMRALQQKEGGSLSWFKLFRHMVRVRVRVRVRVN